MKEKQAMASWYTAAHYNMILGSYCIQNNDKRWHFDQAVNSGVMKGTPEHAFTGELPGPRLNIKTVLSTYGDFHVKDKTAVRTSYI